MESGGETWRMSKPLAIAGGASLNGTLQLSSQAEVRILPIGEESRHSPAVGSASPAEKFPVSR